MRARLACCCSLLLLVAILVPGTARAEGVTEREVTVTSWDGTPLEVVVQEPPGFDPDRAYPVVFHGHGWGGSAPRGSLQRRYAEEGYLAVGWSVRGFGASGGQVGVNGPKEAQDIVALIDWVVDEYRVSNHDGAPGKYDIGFVGDSYGGGSAYLAARFDHRVKAIAPGMPWTRLDHSLYPNGTAKVGWDLLLFAAGAPTSGFTYDPVMYHWFVSLVTTVGYEDTISDLRWRSVADDLDRMNRNGAAVLVNQGISDTLFTGSEATHIWDRLTVPKRLHQTNIGHSNHPQVLADGAPRSESAVRDDLNLAWFDHWLRGVDNGITYLDGTTGCLGGDPDNDLIAGGDAPVLVNHLREDYDERALGRQEDWNGAAVEPVDLHLAADPTGIGIGTLGDTAAGTSVLANTVVQAGVVSGTTVNVVVTDVALPPLLPGAVVPATEAVFRSAPLDAPLTISGEPRLSVELTPLALGLRGSPDGLMQLVAKLYEVGPDGGRELLQRGVLHAGGLEPGVPTPIELTLEAMAHEVPAGSSLELEVGTSDLAYVAPSYSVAVGAIDHDAERPSTLTLPVRTQGRTEWTPPPACADPGAPDTDPDPDPAPRPGLGQGGGGGRDHAPGQQDRPRPGAEAPAPSAGRPAPRVEAAGAGAVTADIAAVPASRTASGRPALPLAVGGLVAAVAAVGAGLGRRERRGG